MKLVNRLLVIAVIAFGSWFLVQQWDKVERIDKYQEVEITEITEEIITGEETEEAIERDIYQVVIGSDPADKPVRRVKPVPTTPKAVTTKVMEAPQPVLSNTESEMTVYLFDGGFDISRSAIPAGNITFNVRNDGRMAHEFAIEGIQDFGRVNPGSMNAFTINLTAGEYELFSPRAVDQTLNMRETLAVENN